MSTMNDGLAGKLGIVEASGAISTDDASSAVGAPGTGADGTGSPTGSLAVNPPPGDLSSLADDDLGTNDGVGDDDEPGVASEGGADDALTARDDEGIVGQTAADGL